jgi:hypothetical protein
MSKPMSVEFIIGQGHARVLAALELLEECNQSMGYFSDSEYLRYKKTVSELQCIAQTYIKAAQMIYIKGDTFEPYDLHGIVMPIAKDV